MNARSCASSASVFSPLTAAKATFALRAGVWFRRGRLLIISPALQPSWPPSGYTLYGAFDVKLLFQALPRCRAPSFSRVLVSSCPEIGTDRPHTSGSMGSGLATAHRDDRREARPRARIVAPQPCMRPIHVGSEP